MTEADVAELMQAKAAIAAGVAALLELAGLNLNELQRLYVAGGFGYHLNPRHAQRCGLLPPLPQERIEVIGNSALGAASLVLLSGLESKLAELEARTRVVELNQVPSFEDHYTEALLFP